MQWGEPQLSLGSWHIPPSYSKENRMNLKAREAESCFCSFCTLFQVKCRGASHQHLKEETIPACERREVRIPFTFALGKKKNVKGRKCCLSSSAAMSRVPLWLGRGLPRWGEQLSAPRLQPAQAGQRGPHGSESGPGPGPGLSGAPCAEQHVGSSVIYLPPKCFTARLRKDHLMCWMLLKTC